jgi:hypothetical protein
MLGSSLRNLEYFCREPNEQSKCHGELNERFASHFQPGSVWYRWGVEKIRAVSTRLSALLRQPIPT